MKKLHFSISTGDRKLYYISDIFSSDSKIIIEVENSTYVILTLLGIYNLRYISELEENKIYELDHHIVTDHTFYSCNLCGKSKSLISNCNEGICGGTSKKMVYVQKYVKNRCECDWTKISDEYYPDETEPVLWCKVPVVEPPIVASMLDTDFNIKDWTHWTYLPKSPDDNN